MIFIYYIYGYTEEERPVTQPVATPTPKPAPVGKSPFPIYVIILITQDLLSDERFLLF